MRLVYVDLVLTVFSDTLRNCTGIGNIASNRTNDFQARATPLAVFGWELKNVRLLVDNYAKARFYCYVPDVHQGDSLPISFLQNVEPPLKDREQVGLVEKAKNAAIVPATLGPWLVKHREAVAEPLISGFINVVRHLPGTNKVGAIGFC